MIDRDKILVDTSKAHRSRLVAAFVHGPHENRRPVNNNLKRFLGSVVLAAVIGVGCVGFSFVMGHLDGNREEEAITSFREAQSQNPLQPDGETLIEDPEESGLLIDTETEEYIDPRTGFVVDPETGLAEDPEGNLVDTRTGWYYEPDTGYYTDPESGVTVDPVNLTVVDEDEE